MKPCLCSSTPNTARKRHVVDVGVHADGVHDEIERNGDRPLHQRVLALDDQLVAVARHLGDARLDVLDLELLLAAPIVVGLVVPVGADIHVVDVDVGVGQLLADLHGHVGRDRAADLRAPLAADLAITAMPTQSRMATRFGLRPSRRAAHALAGRDHLLDLRRRHHVGEGAEAPLRLVDGVEVREAGARGSPRRNRRPSAVGQRGAKGARARRRTTAPWCRACASRSGCASTRATMPPMASFAHEPRRHQLGVARQDRRAAEPAHLLDQHARLSDLRPAHAPPQGPAGPPPTMRMGRVMLVLAHVSGHRPFATRRHRWRAKSGRRSHARPCRAAGVPRLASHQSTASSRLCRPPSTANTDRHRLWWQALRPATPPRQAAKTPAGGSGWRSQTRPPSPAHRPHGRQPGTVSCPTLAPLRMTPIGPAARDFKARSKISGLPEPMQHPDRGI